MAARSGKSNKEALIELRDSMLQRLEVLELFSDNTISRRAIVDGVNRIAAQAAWWALYGGFGPHPTKARCGLNAGGR